MQTFEPLAGTSIDATAKEMVALALKTHDAVTAEFNGIQLMALPGDPWQKISKQYWDESNSATKAWETSPEKAEQDRKYEESRQAKVVTIRETLGVSPPKMTLRDEPAWNECVAVNSDPYGNATVQYADKWARIMEGRIAQGQTLEQCAKEASHIADEDGITGFMYGCAVGILAKVWVHGEALRRWHNHDAQIGSEGDRANETGGVLNPAMLTIGKSS